MIIFYAKGQEKSPLYCVICIFCTKMRYVFPRGMTKVTYFWSRRRRKQRFYSHISDFNAFNILSPVLSFLHTPFLTLVDFLWCSFWKVTCLFLSCFYSNLHFILSTDAYAGQPSDALSSIILTILRGRSVVTEWIWYLSLRNFLWYPVIGTYCSLLWVVLRNERILRDKENFINVVFVLAFLCLLAVYISLLQLVIITSLLNSTRAW